MMEISSNCNSIIIFSNTNYGNYVLSKIFLPYMDNKKYEKYTLTKNKTYLILKRKCLYFANKIFIN